MTYGEWLLAQMRKRRLSIRDLASLAGVSHTAVWKIVHDKDVHLSTMTYLSRVVGWPLFERLVLPREI